MKTLFRLLSSLALCALCLTACQDDEFMSMPTAPTLPPSTDTRAVNATSSLVQNTDGTWRPNGRRVPLVGEGRILDDINTGLIGVINTAGNQECLTDLNLDNALTFAGAASISLEEPFLSVRDIHHTYHDPNGVMVGFAYRESQGQLLDLDVLKGFWVKTYLKGKEQESSVANATSNEMHLLQLQLLSTSGGLREAAFVATLPFDEIQIGSIGVSADVLSVVSNMEICYAFIGQNPEKIAAIGHTYPNATSDGWPMHEELVDNNITSNGPVVELVGSLVGGPNYTVTFNSDEEIPAGSEIGFKTRSGGLASIEAGGVKLTLYGDNGEIKNVTVNNGIGISALGGGENYFSIICPEAGCKKINIDFPWGIKVLDGTQVLYAYTRDPVTIDASSYFSAGNITIAQNSYTLPTPQGGETSWHLLGYTLDDENATAAPNIVTENGITKIIGMSADGKYMLSGTYTPDNGTPINVTFTIKREALTMDAQCDQLLGKTEGAELVAPIDGGFGINIYETIENQEAIVDNDPNNYATWTNAISLLDVSPIVAIDLGETINANKESIKTGFTVQTSFDLLSADVLDFFLVKLYNDGSEVTSIPAESSNVSDIGLIGGQSNKFRIAIETDQSFNHIELWTAGIVNASLKSYRIYNAFWENAEADCPTGGVTEACTEMLTTTHGAQISWEHTSIDGLLNLGATINDLSGLLDDSKETYAYITGGVNLLSNISVGVKFDEMEGPKRIGFILSSTDYVGQIDALGGTILTVYRQGTEVKQVSTGGLLDVGLIGDTEVAYVEMMIDETDGPFDEISIQFPTTLGALKNVRLYGAYIRRDSDANGIPDCAEPGENPTPPSETLTAEITNPDICEGEDLSIKVTDGGTVGDTYELVYYNTSTASVETTIIEQALQESESDGITTRYFTLSGLKVGEYFIRIQKEGKNVSNEALEAYVHPLQTTWKQSPANTDWNNWSNWTDGAPWTCTDVIIPGNCTDYPVLTAEADNYCANLHIAAGGEIVNTQYLDHYDYAWVELKLQPNIYYMLSAPLKEMVTGDMFVPESWDFGNSAEDYFTALTPMIAPESRFTPRVYQRFWASEVPGKIISDGTLASEVIVSQTDWTAPFNAVAEAYGMGMGFSASITGAATFRFPKEHREYTYFDGAGNSTGQTEGVARTTQNVGRFWTDDWTSGNFTVTATNPTESETFVVGNPFMAHINIAKFLEANSSITAVKLYDGNSIVTITQGYATETGYTHIEPMQSFYVTATKSTSLEVTFNAEMQEAKPGYQVVNAPATQTRAETRSLTDGNTLRLTATCDSRSSTCLVRLSPSADDAYRMGEDSRLLIDTQAEPTVAVFTVADGRALDIQQRRSGTDIPVGLRMKQRGRVTLTLSHQKGDDWTGWTLVDRQTGRRYPLTDGYTYIELGTMGTTTDRLYLTKE